VLGALLFAWYDRGGGGGSPSRRIVLAPGTIDQIGAGFERAWQRPPTEGELKGLIDDWVREEIATREAMAMGLDKDDAILRRRLRQKFEFLVEDAASTTPPADADLEAWLSAHAAQYRAGPRLAFRQVYLDPSRRGAALERDVSRLLADLGKRGADAPIEALGDRLMLPAEVEPTEEREVVRIFGERFAEAVLALPVGRWSSPVSSGFGVHIVLVRERADGGLPRVADVRPALERDFMADRRKRQMNALYEKLLGKYTVVVERRPAPSPPASPGATR
jgi:PPIC-type PPIASE domain